MTHRKTWAVKVEFQAFFGIRAFLFHGLHFSPSSIKLVA